MYILHCDDNSGASLVNYKWQLITCMPDAWSVCAVVLMLKINCMKLKHDYVICASLWSPTKEYKCKISM